MGPALLNYPLDPAGLIVILEPLHDKLHLQPGDGFELESAGEMVTDSRPLLNTATQEKRMWVFRTGRQLYRQSTAPRRVFHPEEDRRRLSGISAGFALTPQPA